MTTLLTWKCEIFLNKFPVKKTFNDHFSAIYTSQEFAIWISKSMFFYR